MFMEENNNNFQKFIMQNNYTAFIFFYLIILIQTLLFTSFNTFFPQISKILSKTETILILFYVVYALVIRITIRKIIYTIITLLIIVVMLSHSGTFSSFIKLLLLAIAVPATIPSSRNITKVFGWAMCTTMLISISLSLVGILPQSGTTSRSIVSSYQETVYFLGFNHPNAFGTFLTVLFAILSFLFYQNYKWKIIIIAPFFWIINVMIGAGTAAIGIVLLLIILLFPINLNKIYKILYLLPSSLTLFALWLAYNNMSSIGMILNEKVASRPNVWNAYITQFPIGFVNTPPEINTSGYFGILGNGVLDGSYIYILIFWGILAWVVYNIIFISLIKFSFDTNNKILFGIALLTIITAFPESHMIMFDENAFLLFVGFYQYPINERKECLSL